MKNLFIAFAFLIIGNSGFAKNESYSINDNNLMKEMVISDNYEVTTTSNLEINANGIVEISKTYYLVFNGIFAPCWTTTSYYNSNGVYLGSDTEYNLTANCSDPVEKIVIVRRPSIQQAL